MERFGITAGGQLLEALRYVMVGLLLEVLYEGFRLWRLWRRSNAVGVFFQDILYFALAAGVTELCALPVSQGQVRAFHLLALIAGFLACYFTAGRLFHFLSRRLVALADRLSGAAERLSAAAAKKFSKIVKKSKKPLESSEASIV